MINKLHINASQGVIDVEGDPEFVSRVYSDFKGQIEDLLSNAKFESPTGASDMESDSGNSSGEKTTRKRTQRRKKSDSGSGKKPQASAYKPKLDRNVSLKGLTDFYAKYAPKNNREKVLLFCKFLQKDGAEHCTADQIYTCFTHADPKNLPKAFSQAIIDTRGKAGYIDYETFDEISVSSIGEHHLLTSMAGDV